jgi:hypothetical protein
MADLRRHLIEELMHFSDTDWKYTDSYGIERTAHKATREPGSRSIIFRNRGGLQLRKVYGASIQWAGMTEEVTRTEFKKRRAAIEAQAKNGARK